MSGVVSALAAIGPLARAAQSIADVVKAILGRRSDADQRSAGATAAANETLEDTAELADAQAHLNADHSDARDIARELRSEADRAERAAGSGGDATKRSGAAGA